LVRPNVLSQRFEVFEQPAVAASVED
jgi:hypothetical protein